VIADLHCHYPMHLVPEVHHPRRRAGEWLHRVGDELGQNLVGLLAPALDEASWGAGWRVDLDGLEAGKAAIVCSVLYWPPAEFDLGSLHGAAPTAASFDDLKDLLQSVEQELRTLDPDGERHVIAGTAADLDEEQRVVFAHCIEGGFQLGADEAAIEANVRWMADHGVVYITLAHLFYRQVATNAPAIPMLSDSTYDELFRQPRGVGLTDLGRAALRAMYKHKVLVDVSHMRQETLDETFALLEELDGETGANPDDFPVIATHVGMRSAGPGAQSYNLSDDTARRIHERGGVIGLITAQHQLGDTADQAQSQAVVRRHIDAIGAACDGHAATAIGTDLDGFIKPTLAGVERASDLALLETWIRGAYPAHAEAILCGNARRVLRQALAGRP
jgi:microsomal dipeptidase-like Zn-dependent dipeptidase